jgi:hypothetical protein
LSLSQYRKNTPARGAGPLGWGVEDEWGKKGWEAISCANLLGRHLRKGGVSVASGRQGAMMMVMMQLMMMMAGDTSAPEGDFAIYSRVELSHFSLDRFNLYAERSLQYPGTIETTQYRLAKNNRSSQNDKNIGAAQCRRVAVLAATVPRCPRPCICLQGRR